MRAIRLSFLVLLTPMYAEAAGFCVSAGDTASFEAALNTAAHNSEDDNIMLQEGDYPISNSLSAIFDDNHDVTIEGGYEEFWGNACAFSGNRDGRATIIDGTSVSSVHFLNHSGSLSVGYLTIKNAVSLNKPAVAIESTSVTSLYNSVFLKNESLNGVGLSLYSKNGVRVHNSVFIGSKGVFPVNIYTDNPVGATLCDLIINSTFAWGGAAIQNTGDDCASVIANSIFFGSGDFYDGPYIKGEAYLFNNDLFNTAGITGTADLHLAENFSADPLFVNIWNGDFSLQDGSITQNRGAPGGFLWGPGEKDVVGGERVVGGNPDVGAFELQDVIFGNGFDTPIVAYPSP